MDNHRLAAELREFCRAPEPERKGQFFRKLEQQGMVHKRPVVMTHGEFLLGQFRYIQKWIWVLSAIILLFIMGICYSNPGNYSFALPPLLVAGILVETRRSFRWKMAELEYTARFSLRSVFLARMFLVGAVDTAGLLVVICAIRNWLSYSLIRAFLYMMVPFLCASLFGSLYERKQRADHGWGSIVICIFSSAFFAAAPFVYSRLYEERLTVIWAVAFVLLGCSLVISMRRWIHEMEEPVWSL